MVDITNKKIIPAVEEYIGRLSEIAKNKIKVLENPAVARLEKSVILKLSDLNSRAYDLADKLKAAADAAYSERAKTRKYMDSALAYKNNVIPLMVKLREAVDEMEGIVPSELWPLPSYGEMTLKQ